MGPLISVIVPIYRSEEWLGRCISSIRSQSYPNLEIILVDDGSPDNSGKMCDEYASQDERIRAIHKSNKGVSSARNEGIKASRGEFIQFVDSDDWLEANACSCLLRGMSEAVDMVICGLNITRRGQLIRQPRLSTRICYPSMNFEDFRFIYPILASPCNKLYKRDYIDKFNDNMAMGEDFLFNLEYISKTQSVLTIQDCLYNVCLDNRNSLNRSFRENQLDLMLGLAVSIREFCDSQYGKDYDSSVVDNFVILATHEYFRKTARVKDRGMAMSIMRKYSNLDSIRLASRRANLEALDKKAFNLLLRSGCTFLVYCFFLLKGGLLRVFKTESYR